MREDRGRAHGRWRGLAGLRDDTPSHISATRRHCVEGAGGTGGHGRASRRGAERSCAHHASSRAARNKIRPAQALRRHFREITRPTRGFRRPIREKVRPTRALHRVIREKVRPARLKTAFFGHFGLAGRTFSRSRTHQAAQGELFRAQDTATWRRCNQ